VRYTEPRRRATPVPTPAPAAGLPVPDAGLPALHEAPPFAPLTGATAPTARPERTEVRA
ncbi:MAG: hypothetical protein K0S43_3309, partial [Cellulosimicrobium sp.]|nr:hypothetical protein [Cellulosimicrobium sp.]